MIATGSSDRCKDESRNCPEITPRLIKLNRTSKYKTILILLFRTRFSNLYYACPECSLATITLRNIDTSPLFEEPIRQKYQFKHHTMNQFYKIQQQRIIKINLSKRNQHAKKVAPSQVLSITGRFPHESSTRASLFRDQIQVTGWTGVIAFRNYCILFLNLCRGRLTADTWNQGVILWCIIACRCRDLPQKPSVSS